MASPTVTDQRADAVVSRIERLDAEPARLEAVMLGLVDAVLAGDHATLTAALDALRDHRARSADDHLTGWLDAAIAVAHWGLERAPSPAAVVPGSQAHDFLCLLHGVPHVGSAELRRRLGIDETQVSRTGRRLLEAGLVTRRKAGREVFWGLSPRGMRALEEAPPATGARDLGFWHDAIRRGFEAASGDRPAPPRRTDPTRERIIRRTLELHNEQGIEATTQADVAAAVDVPLETLKALFPTQEDLVRGCGEHFLELVQVPPADRAGEVFAGAASEHERIHRLVELLFGVYERGGAGIAVARRERHAFAAVDESIEALEETFDALVAEGVRFMRPDGAAVATLRGLTDFEVWRTMREHGATPDAAVDEASAAVERWLDARTAAGTGGR